MEAAQVQTILGLQVQRVLQIVAVAAAVLMAMVRLELFLLVVTAVLVLSLLKFRTHAPQPFPAVLHPAFLQQLMVTKYTPSPQRQRPQKRSHLAEE
jgi:hypothetical protein